MVCLNDSLLFNKKKLIYNIPKELNESIRLNFNIYFHNNDELKNIFEKIYKNINDKTKDLFSSDNFIYINMDDNHCTHKFKRGKKEGYICHKKINTNLKDEKKDYLCCAHSKKHVTKKKFNKKQKEKENIIKNNLKINISNPDFLHLKKDDNIYFNYKKNKRIKKKKNKRIFICNGGTINIGKIIKNLL